MKLIKTDAEYRSALGEASKLVALDPEPGTNEADQLELLAVVIEEYEAHSFQVPLPSPLEAIEFRMEQGNLAPRDLIPYLGSRSKVSEVLAGKRPLTLTMIRALHKGLGIPAQVLIQGYSPEELDESELDWKRFPLREMASRGWIHATANELRSQGDELLRTFFRAIEPTQSVALFPRQSIHVRAGRDLDDYALLAWAARVMHCALNETFAVDYRPGTVNLEFARDVGHLSVNDDGPRLARDLLRKHGIALVIERQLRHTRLDGAALLVTAHRPIIGLTLRFDRLDNFWFTLMHELGHIALHSGGEIERFFDDLEADARNDVREKEADAFADEALVPDAAWEASDVRLLKTPHTIQILADNLKVHPAIVAGKIRYEDKAFRLFTKLVGHGEVRRHFPEYEKGCQ